MPGQPVRNTSRIEAGRNDFRRKIDAYLKNSHSDVKEALHVMLLLLPLLLACRFQDDQARHDDQIEIQKHILPTGILLIHFDSL